MKVDQEVCCCDNVHRTIATIEDGDALMVEGGRFSIEHCLMEIAEDGSCHDTTLA